MAEKFRFFIIGYELKIYFKHIQILKKIKICIKKKKLCLGYIAISVRHCDIWKKYRTDGIRKEEQRSFKVSALREQDQIRQK